MSHAGRDRRRSVGGVAVVVVLAALLLTPPAQARLKALAVGGEALGIALPRPFAADVTRMETRVAGVLGDLYAGEEAAPAMVLLPGATPAGRGDRRAVAVARAVSRAGRTVFVPELALYSRRIDEGDLDRIVRAALALPDHPLGEGPPSIVGFSYGGSYGLVAAADPRLGGRLAQVATFGSYWDLVGVLQATTTGTSILDGERLEWDGDPRAWDILAEHAVQLAPSDQRRTLTAVLEDQADPAVLDPDARGIHALMTNDDPERTRVLVRRTAPEARRALARFSPSVVADEIDAPLVALHAVDDPAVPHAEALRLKRDRPDARLLTVELFTHVDFEGVGLLQAAPDLWRVWRFTGWVLAAQER
ncbi:MAG TPA: alpha/beta hydrolase [Egibacteraceae bacterium]|nr:alpha/beta hydrolase [Egibacteraceae bacterium]